MSDFGAEIKIFTTFLSLDIPICQTRVREFTPRAAQLSEDIVILAVSKDLPFAQKGFCETEGVNRIFVLSDDKYSSAGIN